MAVFLFFIIEGYGVGFLSGIIDFVSFFLSFVIALKYYSLFASNISHILSLSIGFSNAIAFMLLAFLLEILIGKLSKKIIGAYVLKTISSKAGLLKVNNFLGIIPGFLSCTIIVTFFLTLFMSLPLSPSLKNYISESKIGSFFVSNTQGIEKNISSIFGGAALDTLNFLTVEPKSNESVSLNFKTDNFSIDQKSEQEMFEIVNIEREKAGAAKLVFNNSLSEVGRAHCEDMFKRGYFSHYTPEGLSPFDRMDKSNISYSYAGENLALAPNVQTAMQGLMNSPGHKANIMSVNFGKVGIGAIDGGIYGEMFCQEFTD